MKVLLFVPQSRCEKYSDPAAIPADAELVYAESGWSTEDILKAGGDAECVVVDAVMPFRADVALILGFVGANSSASQQYSYSFLNLRKGCKNLKFILSLLV